LSLTTTIAEIRRNQRRQALIIARQEELIGDLLAALGVKASIYDGGSCDQPPPDDQWICTAEAASICGRTQAHVARLARANDLKTNPGGFAKGNGGQWLIWPARFRRYLKAGRRRITPS
jgi:hypothetical protein